MDGRMKTTQAASNTCALGSGQLRVGEGQAGLRPWCCRVVYVN